MSLPVGRTLSALALLLAFTATGAAAEIQVEGLTEENVNATFINDSTIKFETSYLDKNLTPRQVFVPNATDHAVVDWTHTRDTWNGSTGISTLNYQYGLAPDYDYPSPETSALLGQNDSVSGLPANYYQYGDSFYSNESPVRGTVFESSFDEPVELSGNELLGQATWNVTVGSHYEHLVIDYQLIYNGTVQDSFTDVFSGEDTQRIPASANILKYERNGEYQDRVSISNDRLYEYSQKGFQVVILTDKNRSFRGIETYNVNSVTEASSSNIYENVKNEAHSLNMTDVLVDDVSDYQVHSYNMTLEGNTTARIKAFQKSPKGVQANMSIYILGSFAGGSGTSSDPYQIDTCQQLQDMNTDLDASYELISNIDCSDTSNWNGGSGFKPISFEGAVLNGDGYNVSGLYIDRPSTGDVGLESDGYGTIKNIGLRNVDFTGNDRVGAITGDGYIDIFSSYATGRVEDTSYGAGGLAGYIGCSKVNNSFSKVDVVGDDYNGGLIGKISCTGTEVKNSYSTGSVTSAGSNVGGLTSENSGTVTDSYWDIESSGQDTSAAGTGLTTSKMTYPDAEGNMAFDFSNVWNRDDDTDNEGYPYQDIHCHIDGTCNSPPSITNSKFVDNRQSSVTEFELTLDDKTESDISSFSGFTSSKIFTNTSLVSSVSLPFSSTVDVSDFPGASTSKSLNVSESDTGLREDDYSHGLGTQRINRSVTINNNAGSSIDYSLTTDLPGATVVQGQTFTGTISGSDSVTETSITEGDFLAVASTSSKNYTNTSRTQKPDAQYVVNKDNITVSNSQGFGFGQVNTSSRCNTNTSVDIPGSGVEVDGCNITENQVDVIQDTNYSASAPNTVTIGDNYTLTKKVELNETLGVSFSTVDLEQSIANPVPGVCGLSSGATATLDADAVNNKSMKYDCSSGEIINGTSDFEEDTPTPDYDTVVHTFTVDIPSNATDESNLVVEVDEDELPNWDDRTAGSVEIQVDDKSSNLSVQDRLGFVEVTVGDEFGNSSLHEGQHTGELSYYYQTSSGGDDSGGGGGGGGGGEETTVIRNVTGDRYSWVVRAEGTDNARQFNKLRGPGQTFTETIVLENTGSRPVNLSLACATTQSDVCSQLSIGRSEVRLNASAGGTSEEVDVTFQVPEDAESGRLYKFSVEVTDPSYSSDGLEGRALVDFEVSVNPVAGFLLSTFGKAFKTGLVLGLPVPFFVYPLLLSLVTGASFLVAGQMFPVGRRPVYQISVFALAAVVFIAAFPLL